MSYNNQKKLQSLNKKEQDEYDADLTERVEQVYEVLKNKIATSPKVSDDILHSFQRLTLVRKKWLDEIKTLPETDELKKILKKQYWVDIEFGINVPIKYDERIRPFIYNSVKKRIKDEIRLNKNYLRSPFDFFDKELFQRKGFPIPDAGIPYDWNEDTLTVRYYYKNPPKIEDPDLEWKDLISYWMWYWSDIYAGSEMVGYIRDGHEWIPGNPEDYDEDSDLQVSLCFAKITIFGEQCFQVGYSVLPKSKKEEKCQRVE